MVVDLCFLFTHVDESKLSRMALALSGLLALAPRLAGIRRAATRLYHQAIAPALGWQVVAVGAEAWQRASIRLIN